MKAVLSNDLFTDSARSIRNRDEAVSYFDWLNDNERHRLLKRCNATQSEYSSDRCIHERFEKQASERPEAIAMVYEDRELSYGQLNKEANKLAHHLRSFAVGPNALAAICMERGLEMVVGLLAILKAGGAYVLLDPTYPTEQLTYILQDSSPVVVLTHSMIDESVKTCLASALTAECAIINLDVNARCWENASESNPNQDRIGLAPEHLAYVIYSSGSNGTLKAVMVKHNSVCNPSDTKIKGVGVRPDSRVLQFTSLSLDACLSEIVSTLGSGATLFLAAQDKALTGEVLMRTIRQYRITHVILPPDTPIVHRFRI